MTVRELIIRLSNLPEYMQNFDVVIGDPDGTSKAYPLDDLRDGMYLNTTNRAGTFLTDEDEREYFTAICLFAEDD
jgi:hypothetical protein